MNSSLDSYSFRINDVEKIHKSGTFQLPQQYASSYTLLIVAEGEGILTREQGKLRVQSPSAHWFAPGSTLGIRSSAERGIQLYLIRFDCYRECRDEQNKLYMKQIDSFADVDTPDLKDNLDWNINGTWLLPACEAMYEQWYSGKPGAGTRTLGLFLQLLCDLYEQESVAEGDVHVQLQRTHSYIQQHYREQLTLEQLAEMAGLSRNYYISLFKKQYGESVVHYITRLRMEQARKLMVNPELRLRDIAHQVGYQDEFYFSRKFKQETGITPSAYIRNRTRKIASYDPIATGYLLALNIMPYAAPLHPKWTAHDKHRYAEEIPVHLKVQRAAAHWQENISILRDCAPELIISPTNITAVEKEQLEQIAEVYYIDPSTFQWKEQLLQLAEQLNAVQAAVRWLDHYHQQLTSGKYVSDKQSKDQPHQQNSIPLSQPAIGTEHKERTLFLRYWKGNFYSCHPSEAAHMLRQDLGVQLIHLADPDVTEDEDTPLSIDRIHRADADCILLLICQESETLQQWKQLMTQLEWVNVRAVREERVHILSSDPWRDRSPEAYKRMAAEMKKLQSRIPVASI